MGITVLARYVLQATGPLNRLLPLDMETAVKFCWDIKVRLRFYESYSPFRKIWKPHFEIGNDALPQLLHIISEAPLMFSNCPNATKKTLDCRYER